MPNIMRQIAQQYNAKVDLNTGIRIQISGKHENNNKRQKRIQ